MSPPHFIKKISPKQNRFSSMFKAWQKILDFQICRKQSMKNIKTEILYPQLIDQSEKAQSSKTKKVL